MAKSMNDLEKRLGSIFGSNSETATTSSKQGTEVGLPTNDDWTSYLSQDNLSRVGSNLDFDDQKFQLANQLASQDLENRVSGKRKSNRELKELTNQYYKDLGGTGDLFNNGTFMSAGLGIGDMLDDLYYGLGSMADATFDATVGNLAGLVLGDEAGNSVKNWKTGEDLAPWVSTGLDLATWAIPGAAPLKVALLGAKGLADNRESIAQALTGKDSQTGEDLTSGQQFASGLAGALGTGLTILPGGGLAKGAERNLAAKALENAAGKNKDAIEALTKQIGPEGKYVKARRSADDITSMIEGTDDFAKYIDPGKRASSKWRDANNFLQDARAARAANLEAEEAKNLAENTLLPTGASGFRGLGSDLAERINLPRKGNSPSLADRFLAGRRKALEDIRSKDDIKTQIKKKEANLEKFKEENAPAKNADQTAIDTFNDAVKAAEDEIAELRKGTSKKSGVGDKIDEFKENRETLRMPDVLRGLGLNVGNAALQTSAALGSDSENMFYDLANYATQNPLEFYGTLGLGLLPGLGNTKIYRAGFSPLTTKNAYQSDLLTNLIRQNYAGSAGDLDEETLMVLDQLLSGMTPETARSNVETYMNAQKKAAQEKEAAEESEEEK